VPHGTRLATLIESRTSLRSSCSVTIRGARSHVTTPIPAHAAESLLPRPSDPVALNAVPKTPHGPSTRRWWSYHGQSRPRALDAQEQIDLTTIPPPPGRVGPHPRPPGRDRAAAGKVGYSDEDERHHAVVSFVEPIRSGYVLIQRHVVNVTSLEHERWKRAHPELCRKMGIS